MMKKLLSLLLAAALALTLTACAGGSDGESEGGESHIADPGEVRGVAEGSTYKNDFLELKFTKPDSWTFATEDEIAGIAGNTQDILSEGGVESEVDASRFDMIATDAVTGNNVNLSLEIIDQEATDEDLEAVLDATEERLLEMGSSIGMNYTFGEHSKVTLGGLEYHKLSATAEYREVTFEQGCYVAVKDGVLINITATSYDGTAISDFEAMFS